MNVNVWEFQQGKKNLNQGRIPLIVKNFNALDCPAGAVQKKEYEHVWVYVCFVYIKKEQAF